MHACIIHSCGKAVIAGKLLSVSIASSPIIFKDKRGGEKRMEWNGKKAREEKRREEKKGIREGRRGKESTREEIRRDGERNSKERRREGK